jgi:hypothetical protein
MASASSSLKSRLITHCAVTRELRQPTDQKHRTPRADAVDIKAGLLWVSAVRHDLPFGRLLVTCPVAANTP